MIDDADGESYSDSTLTALLVAFDDDFNAVAAQCWGDKASSIWNTHYNFSADGANYSLSDVYAHCMEKANYYNSHRRPTTSVWTKNPLETDNGLFIDSDAIVNDTLDEVF